MALGPWICRVVESGSDPTWCGWWTFITYAGEENKIITVISAYQVGNQHQPDALTAYQQQYRIQYQDESLRPYILDSHFQTMIDLEYFAKLLRAKGHNIFLFIEANEGFEHRFQPQVHKVVFKTDNGFHVDGTIDGSLRKFM
jgi:hypothetical protein